MAKLAPINNELEKSEIRVIVELIEYVPHAVVSRTILKKATGNVTVSSFAAGEELAEKITPFDTFVQIIDGTADLHMEKKKLKLQLGEGIIIPAHVSHHFNAHEPFKMLSTVIKSGYEE